MKIWAKILFLLAGAVSAAAAAPSYSVVQAILNERCVDCHAAGEAENDLVLESFDAFAKGGKTGAAFLAKNSDKSLLVQMIEGRPDVKIMPPGKRKKLAPEEIKLIREWIDAGAVGMAKEIAVKPMTAPSIKPTVLPRDPVLALAYSPVINHLAVGRYRAVDLMPPRGSTGKITLAAGRLDGARGNVNKVVFSQDGAHLFGASGEEVRGGQILQWDVMTGKIIHEFKGHTDAVYSLALSPDGKVLASGSYDQKIRLWNSATGEELRVLHGHSGAIFGLAFRPDGKVLASASGDATIKLWDVETGKRLDTLSQPLKEQYAVAFHPSGQSLFAGGVDNRIRQWRVSATAQEGSNEIVASRFAHEGSILALAFSFDGKSLASTADDGTAKIWATENWKEKLALENQPDWPVAAAFLANDQALAVGRLDGTFEQYQTADGKVVTLPKPKLVRAEPGGIQIGGTTKVRLVGEALGLDGKPKIDLAGISAQITPEDGNGSVLWVTFTAQPDVSPRAFSFSLVGPGGESNALKFHADTLPQLVQDSGQMATLPAAVWGSFGKPGERDEIRFDAKCGQRLVFDCAAQSLGAKTAPLLTLHAPSGERLATSRGDETSRDPLFEAEMPADGTYTVRLSETLLGATPEHFYRLSVGEFAFVTAAHPLAVSVGQDTMLSLAGYNLKGKDCVFVRPAAAGDLAVPLDPQVYRQRGEIKVLATTTPERVEAEPNNEANSAQPLTIEQSVSGQFSGSVADEDFFQFQARAGQSLVVETLARRRGSPADTKIEVLWPDGQAVERALLQAVRDTAVAFRGEDSFEPGIRLDNWEEMTLNQFIYLRGEVIRITEMPKGPDSDVGFFQVNGRRRTYFGTSSASHALNEAGYVVEPHPPGTKLAANGLPVFPIHYTNDDDDERKLAEDSRLLFTAPKDGAYLVRVAESRGFHGPRYAYRLTVREARPDFRVSLGMRDPAIPPGTGRDFAVNAERVDGFDGEIHVELSRLPNGFVVSNPVTVQEGHLSAQGTLFAASDATAPSAETAAASKIIAWAMINGQRVEHEVANFGKVSLGQAPSLAVSLTAKRQAASSQEEITIRPGTTISAWLRVERQGHDDLVTFNVHNLPHGVIVDNIGLSGVLIPKGESEREIFLTAYDWVPATERPCFAQANQAGNPTSKPALLRVAR